MEKKSEKTLVNRVAKSGIQTLDLSTFLPEKEIAELDIKNQLFQGLLLREKDFRAFVSDHDWSQYDGKYLAVFCSSDAIIPMWAYMLIAAFGSEFAEEIHIGTGSSFLEVLMKRNLKKNLDLNRFKGKPAIIKGCNKRDVPAGVYATAVTMLKPVARSIMFGEACSTVPVYKKNTIHR